MTVLFGSGRVILHVGGSAFSKERHRVEARCGLLFKSIVRYGTELRHLG